MTATATRLDLRLRRLAPDDMSRVVAIDALHRGCAVPDYWARVCADFLSRGRDRVRVAVAAEVGGALVGYVLGEVRAFEFGSEPCGWIFAIGVDPAFARSGVARALLGEAGRRFAAAGIRTLRTMVRRDDVPVLSFFRASGFHGGAFVQLEVDLNGEVRA
ncbi:MAG: GNAT family N-acetyltransferase [Thermoanaerobaculia bacterium]|nr:MAG: GNAT family N-acetyltransferase [Thermoanaerobaculia bacterium]